MMIIEKNDIIDFKLGNNFCALGGNFYIDPNDIKDAQEISIDDIQNIIKKFNDNVIVYGHLKLRINTVLFSDCFYYNEKEKDSIADIINDLEQIDSEQQMYMYTINVK